MSDEPQQAATPRTDIESFRSTAEHGVGMGKFVTADFARTLERELAAMAKNRDECAAVFEMDRRHELVPNDNCECPSCNLHRHLAALRAERDALVAELNRTAADAYAGFTSVSDEMVAKWRDDSSMNPDLRYDAGRLLQVRALLAARSSGGKERAT